MAGTLALAALSTPLITRAAAPPAAPAAGAPAAGPAGGGRGGGGLLGAAGGGRGGAAATPLPPALGGQQLSIVVGDPDLGKKFFNGSIGRCSSCHAVTDGATSKAENLAHIATKYTDPKTLQNNMILNRTGGWSQRTSKDITATATYKSGKKTSGYLSDLSDFQLTIHDDAGKETKIPIVNGDPKVTMVDRLQAHLDLLPKYQDDDIHNLTAYLVTLK